MLVTIEGKKGEEGQNLIDNAIVFAGTTKDVREKLEKQKPLADLNSMITCLNNISESLFKFEDTKNGIHKVIGAFDEILKYMTPKEFEAFHLLVTMSRNYIYFR